MRKLLFILFIVFDIWFDPTKLFSQIERNIELLDFANNRSIGVNVKEDWASQNIVLINRNHNIFDTIKVCNVQEIDTMYIALNRFLIISYRFNGGSGEHLEDTKIFTVKNATLFESLSLLTRHESFSSSGILQREYSVSFTINKLKNNYGISLIEKERKKQKSTCSKLFKLSLDMDFMVFYSFIVERNKTICIDEKSIKANNDLFRVCLKKESYIFYKKGWYQRGRKRCFYRI